MKYTNELQRRCAPETQVLEDAVKYYYSFLAKFPDGHSIGVRGAAKTFLEAVGEINRRVREVVAGGRVMTVIKTEIKVKP